MSISRRQLLALGGGAIATLAGPAGMLRAGAPAGTTAGAATETTVEVVMRASHRGEIREGLLRLLGHATRDHLTGGGIERDLPGQVDRVTGTNRL